MLAEPLSSAEVLRLARVDLLLRRHAYQEALEEMGRLPKALHGDPLFQRYMNRAFAGLYAPPADQARFRTVPQKRRVLQTLRVTRRKQDANAASDQNSDNRGWQIHEELEAQVTTRGGLTGRFLLGLDGFRNGHNDFRYRKLLGDFSKGGARFSAGDVASFPNPYLLRGSEFRGVNLLLSGETHRLQTFFGGYPVWLERRDEYIYPRTVLGLYDQWKGPGERFTLGAGLAQTRDSEKIRSIDTDRQPRDNLLFTMDQTVKLIPEVWFLKAAQGYSVTDDNLIEDRFGDTRKLKDTAWMLESRFIQPWVRWRSYYERTGPDFRVLTEIPSGAVNNPKAVTSDRWFMNHFWDFDPLGPFDLDLGFSQYRNNLDDDATVAQTRQHWATANLGIRVPEDWPRPRLRASWIDTVTTPGPTSSASQSRIWDLRGELAHRLHSLRVTEFLTYRTELPMKDRVDFDEEEQWGMGLRVGAPLGDRFFASARYAYEAFDELFNERRERGMRHEVNLSGGLRLWSSASLGLSYSFLTGKLIDPASVNLTHAQGHLGSVTFGWPYQRRSPDLRRSWSAHPSMELYFSDFNQGLQKRPLAAGRLKLGYAVLEDWRVELGGEFHYDHDDEGLNVRTEESRLWLLWESQWQ